jgi:hypothetical protein
MGEKAFELPADFVPERPGEVRRQKILETGARGGRRKDSGPIRERRNARCASGAEDKVEADAERGIAARDADGILGGRFVDHETGLREDAGAVGALDGGIDFRAAAEIVGGKDELFQNAGGLCILRFSFR